MRIALLAAALALIPLPASAQDRPDAAALRASVDTLVGFGTRHTASDTVSDTRGIGAARRWAANRLNAISDACGGCIEVANIARGFTGPRAPDGVQVVDVLGFQRGQDTHRVIIVMAHIDSRNSDVMDKSGDAPGANDDGSGVAVVLETARILSQQKFRATIVYAITSGEEQGLWGGELLAKTAKSLNWTVSAVINNDIVGNSMGTDGTVVADRVRVFSEGIAAGADADAVRLIRASGGEDDGPGRALAKAVHGIAADLPGGLAVTLVRRPDRFGRGGDQAPFQDLGYPAIRISSGVENYDRQHQNPRVDGGRAYGDSADAMDFDYLAKVTAINIAAVRRLASAPAAPGDVVISGAVSSDTTVRWSPVPGAVRYRVHWRRADQQDWTDQRDVTDPSLVLKGVIIDDHFFGVSAISADGAESLVSFAGAKPR